MADEIIDFDAPVGEQDATAQADVVSAITRIASLNARAIMPDGRTLNRAEILQSLGLNPNTAPTAWLNIIGCGSNASALLPGDLQRVAVNRVGNASAVLKRIQEIGPGSSGGRGFTSGGGAPGR